MPRLSPLGLADMHVSSKNGFTRRARRAGERGLVRAYKYPRVVEQRLLELSCVDRTRSRPREHRERR